LSSLRRVKKGPGRRPLSAKRQRFMELRGRGWSILAAAGEVGVSRTTANNWSRGYKTYRHGQVVGFVPTLERPAVRRISSRVVTQEERIEIADLRDAGAEHPSNRAALRRAASTISRELRHNAAGDCGYRPFEAHRRATTRRARGHRRRIDTDAELRRLIVTLLDQRWSPAADQGTAGQVSRTGLGGGCVTRASTRRSTGQDQH
jgi:transposase, IS30 family